MSDHRTDHIPTKKSRSKVKPLEDKIQSLKYQNEKLLEEMYEAGLKTRPTIMSQIKEKEAQAIESIKYIIDKCEKETGRPFPKVLIPHIY